MHAGTQSPAKRPGLPRRWCVPPAITRGLGETVDGNCILAESAGALGVLLWRTARDVALWGQTPPGHQGGLFADGSGDGRIIQLTAIELPPAISAAVDTIHGMLTLGARADPEILSLCCLEIAAWAHRAGLAQTALEFAQAGAVASPEFGEAALHTGIYALRAGQVARAGTWLRRAVGVSRREKDRSAYAAALVELGALYEGLANTEQAERFFRLGYRAGKRYPARSARMGAVHGLFRLARAGGDEASAAEFALAAHAQYEPDAAGGPALLLDLARFWTDVEEPGRARAALRRLAPLRTQLPAAGQLAVAAITARAFSVAGSRRKNLSTAAAATAWTVMVDEAIPVDARSAAALDLAHAARISGDLLAFTQAKCALLTHAPQPAHPALAAAVAELWPTEVAASKLERAS